MTATALRREVGPARGRVTNDDIEVLAWTRRRSSLALRGSCNARNVLRNGFDVVLRNGHRRHRRHARILQPVANDWKDQFTRLIVENESRAQQIRPAIFA